MFDYVFNFVYIVYGVNFACFFIFVDKRGHRLQGIAALHEIIEGMGSFKGGSFTGLFGRIF